MGITQEDYDENNARYSEELASIADQERRLDNADTNFYITVGYLLAIFEHAADFFKRAKLEEKRQIVGLLFSNLQFDGKKILFSLKKPFDELVDSSKGSVWRRVEDSNLRCRFPHTSDLANRPLQPLG